MSIMSNWSEGSKLIFVKIAAIDYAFIDLGSIIEKNLLNLAS